VFESGDDSIFANQEISRVRGQTTEERFYIYIYRNVLLDLKRVSLLSYLCTFL